MFGMDGESDERWPKLRQEAKEHQSDSCGLSIFGLKRKIYLVYISIKLCVECLTVDSFVVFLLLL